MERIIPGVDVQEQQRMIEHAIAHGNTLLVEIGQALDENMERIPYRARMTPTSLRKSAKGLRVYCELKDEQEYLARNSNQFEGDRQILLGTFEILG